MYKTLMVHGKWHVLKIVESRYSNKIDDANYMGKGLALCGILKKNETIEDFERRQKKNKIRNSKKRQQVGIIKRI